MDREEKIMFCTKCGTQLEDDDLFCFNCGAKITRKKINESGVNKQKDEDEVKQSKENTDTTENSKKIEQSIAKEKPQYKENSELEPEQSQKFPQKSEQFDFYGNRVAFSASALKEIIMLRKQVTKAEEYRNKVLDAQLKIKGLSNIDAFESKIKEYGYDYADYVYCSLIQNGIDSISKNEVERQMNISGTLLKVHDFKYQLQDQLTKAAGDKEYALAYNEARKAGRTKLVGGGFGLKGAAKGIVTAKAVNAVTGSIYSIGNAFAGASINSRYRATVNEVNGKGFDGTLSSDFYSECLSFLFKIYTVLNKKNVKLEYTYLGKKEADDVLSGIEESIVYKDNTEDRKKLAKDFVNIVSSYPVEDKYFISICSRLGDRNGEVRRFCQIINMDTVDIERAIVSFEYHSNLFDNNDPNINIYNVINYRMLGSQDIDDNIREILNDEFEDETLKSIAKEMEEDETYNHLHYLVEDCMKYFVGFGINHYLDEDYMNAPHLLMSSLKIRLMKGSHQYYSFEYGNNLDLLSGLKSIDFTYQNPMCLIWRRGLESEINEKQSQYIFLTSENLYTNDLTIPIMNIYRIDYDEGKKLVVVNSNNVLPMTGMSDRSTQTVLYTAVLFLQLLHEWGEKNKAIPLLSMISKMSRNYTKPVRNIYKETKIYYLTNEGILNETTKKNLRKMKNYLFYKGYDDTGWLNGGGLDKIDEAYKIQTDNDEMFILVYEYESGFSNIGFAITNKRFIYLNEKTERYESKDIVDFDKNTFNYNNGLVPNFVVFGDKIDAFGNEKTVKSFYDIIYYIVEELNISNLKIPEKISYDRDRIITKSTSQILDTLGDKDDETVLSEVFRTLVEENRFSDVYVKGHVPNEADNIVWSLFRLDHDEKVFYCDNRPLFKKPQKNGYLITTKGIRLLNKEVLTFISWTEIKKAKVIDNYGGRICINDNINLTSYTYKSIYLLLVRLERVWGEPLVFLQNEDRKTYSHKNEESLSEQAVLSMIKKHIEKSSEQITQKSPVFVLNAVSFEEFYTKCFEHSNTLVDEWDNMINELAKVLNDIQSLNTSGVISIVNIDDDSWNAMCDFQDGCEKFDAEEVMVAYLPMDNSEREGKYGIMLTNKYLRWNIDIEGNVQKDKKCIKDLYGDKNNELINFMVKNNPQKQVQIEDSLKHLYQIVECIKIKGE